MSHLEPSTLARYNSLTDPHLQGYFSNDRIRSHLKRAGLVSGRGEVLSDAEYRTRLAQREHHKHVRHMLAENIVNRAIDMERARSAGMKRQLEMVAKAALVNDVRESRRRGGGNPAGFLSHSSDMALLSVNTSWSQARPRSANYHSDTNDEYTHIPRIQSASLAGGHRMKSPSKNRNRRTLPRQRPKSSQRPRSSVKYPDATESSPPCEITMVYYGPHTKIDYDRMVFSDADEVMVMQQHCGGENLVVYKKYLKPGAEFTFKSRRHSDYTFGLSLYIKGLIDSRISTCCEYKHRYGVRLGGDRGHFAIVSVAGSKPCIKCQFEKQARLDKYAQSSNDKEARKEKPLTVSLSVSDEPKSKQIPVQIPVRHTSISNDSYAEDFDDGDKRDKHSKRSSQSSSVAPKVAPRALHATDKASSKSDDTYDVNSKKGSMKKTWQVIFHPSKLPTGNFQTGSKTSSKRFLLKFSFIGKDDDDETEPYEIDMKPFLSESKSAKPHSFPTKLRNIGKPKQIHVRMLTTQEDDDDDDEEEEDIKWHLDHIEVIDPETQTHSIFPCKQWIRPLQDKYLQLSQEYSGEEGDGKTFENNDSSPPPVIHKGRVPKSKFEQKHRTSSGSPTQSPSLSLSKQKHRSAHQLSSDQDSDESTHRKPKIPPGSNRSSTSSENSKPVKKPSTRQPPSADESDPPTPKQPPKRQAHSASSTASTSPKVLKHQYQPPKRPSSDDDSDQSTPRVTPKPKTSLPSTGSKPSQKPTKQTQRASSEDDSEASTPKEKTKPKIDSRSSTPTNPPKVSKKPEEPPKRTFVDDDDSDQSTSKKTSKPKTPATTTDSPHRKPSDLEDAPVTSKVKSSRSTDDKQVTPQKHQSTDRDLRERSPSFQSMADEEADYRKIFKQLDPNNEWELGSPPPTPLPRPITRRGRDNSTVQDHSSTPGVPSLVLKGLTDDTPRSDDQNSHHAHSSSTEKTQKTPSLTYKKANAGASDDD